MSAPEIVLKKLQRTTKSGNRLGITVNDFPAGFRLSAYIFTLRKKHNITMVMEEDHSKGYRRQIGRYFYKSTK
jgi:hypothetical protein